MKKLKQGFSLIEVLAAVAIISIIASITIMNYQDSQKKAQQAKIKTDWTITEGKYIEKLIGKWSFDEGSGSTAFDDTDFRNNGTLNGSPVWKDSKDCINEKCLEFNGSSQYVLTSGVPSNFLSGSKARTLSAWIYRTNETGGTIIAINNSGSLQSFCFQIASSGGVMYLFSDKVNASNNIVISGSEIPSLNTWNYMVFTYDGINAWKYYLNGVLKKSGNFAVAIDTVPNNISIGRRMDAFSAYWPGKIDEVSIYSEAITFSKIKNDYVVGLEKLYQKGAISESNYISKISELQKDNLAEK
ncbi:LamG domain-containing protein [bacterium]|nr:LamG domain-containing protein [bacterium]